MKKCHANLGVNLMKDGAAKAASVKQICYSFTIIMYYLIPEDMVRTFTHEDPTSFQTLGSQFFYTTFKGSPPPCWQVTILTSLEHCLLGKDQVFHLKLQKPKTH